MNTKVNAYNDAASKRFVSMFRDALAPVIAAICPGHLLHHINLVRTSQDHGRYEEVEIRLVLRPIGEANVVSDQPERGTNWPFPSNKISAAPVATALPSNVPGPGSKDAT